MTVPHPAPGGAWPHPRRWRCATAPRSAAPVPARSPEWRRPPAPSPAARIPPYHLPQSPAPLVKRILSDPALATERPGLLPTGLLLGDQLAPITTLLFSHPSRIQRSGLRRKGGSQAAYHSILVLGREDFQRIAADGLQAIMLMCALKRGWVPEEQLPGYRRTTTTHRDLVTISVLESRIWRKIVKVLDSGARQPETDRCFRADGGI